MTVAALTDAERARQLRRAIVASTVGTTIEWYDFFLYSTASGLVFARLFFPESDPLTRTLTFGIYFVGFTGFAVAGYILVCAVISLIAAALMRERARTDISIEYDEAELTPTPARASAPSMGT